MERITAESLVYRAMHKVSSSIDHSIAKLYDLYEVSYVICSVTSYRATLPSLTTGEQIIEDLDNLRTFRYSKGKYDQLLQAASNT